MLRPVRRIVTGHDEFGDSTVISDDISPHTKADRLTDLWRTFSAPASNTEDGEAADVTVELKPPSNGTVFRYFQIKPESETEEKNAEEKQQEAAELFEAMSANNARDSDARHPNMHKTDSVDYIILLSGEVTMLLDKGEVTLKQFDVVVQRGTNHAWVNYGTEPAILAAILVDARPFQK